ncbi:MAG: cytochrome c3 family protein [Planctomycetota bacterium]
MAQLEPQDREVLSSNSCAQECHVEIWNRPVMHGPASSDCSVCHVQGSPDVHDFFLIADSNELCIRCHQIPHQDMAHTPVSEGQCLSCHDPHGSEHPNVLVSSPAQLCSQCHQDQFANAAHVHGPVAIGACAVCHNSHSAPRDHLLREDSQQLCLSCHSEVLDLAEGEHLHAALQQDCTSCHDPHASDHQFMLRANTPDLCITCHGDVMQSPSGENAHVHGALLQEGGCSQCHSPHTSMLPNLQKATQPAICLSCHNDQLVHGIDGKPLQNMQAVLADNSFHHGPIRNGDCTTCHTPHTGDHFRLLTSDYPPEFYAPFNMEQYELCFQCHIPDLVQDPDGQGLTNFRDGDTNLHYLHVNKEKGRTCRACHEVHASSRPAHIRDSVPFGDSGWMLEINYTQNELGGSCAPACHAPSTYQRGEKIEIPAIDPTAQSTTESP